MTQLALVPNSASLFSVRGILHFLSAPQDLFRVMLGPGNICDREHWLSRSRLWRAFFLQNEDGYWDASESLAVSLQARAV